MIAHRVANEISRLLAEDQLPQREIARRLGVSRGTVSGISTGKRSVRTAKRREIEDDGPPQRCPTCGAMVLMPCRSCRTRAAMAKLPRPPILARLRPWEEPLGVELRGDERGRYEAVHESRCRSENPSLPIEVKDEFAPDDDEYLCELNPDDVLDAFEFDDEP